MLELNGKDLKLMSEPLGEIVLEWKDVDISLNKWYASRHWHFRNKEKEFWTAIFMKLLPKRLKQVDKYKLHLRYNSRLDPTNTITMLKLAEDTMKKNHYIIDDTKKYCKGVSIEPDETMGKKHYILTLEIISYAREKTSDSK
jgi:hypothetical protein